MSLSVEQLLLERDEEWRDAIVPGGPSFIKEQVAKPMDAYTWLQAVQETNYECITYFQMRADKARLRRREAEHNLELIAQAWEQSKFANCDPGFPRHVEAILSVALAKVKRRKQKETVS